LAFVVQVLKRFPIVPRRPFLINVLIFEKKGKC
jgi:hypothetical protein